MIIIHAHTIYNDVLRNQRARNYKIICVMFEVKNCEILDFLIFFFNTDEIPNRYLPIS